MRLMCNKYRPIIFSMFMSTEYVIIKAEVLMGKEGVMLNVRLVCPISSHRH